MQDDTLETIYKVCVGLVILFALVVTGLFWCGLVYLVWQLPTILKGL